jgi:hypothetical protein
MGKAEHLSVDAETILRVLSENSELTKVVMALTADNQVTKLAYLSQRLETLNDRQAVAVASLRDEMAKMNNRLERVESRLNEAGRMFKQLAKEKKGAAS